MNQIEPTGLAGRAASSPPPSKLRRVEPRAPSIDKSSSPPSAGSQVRRSTRIHEKQEKDPRSMEKEENSGSRSPSRSRSRSRSSVSKKLHAAAVDMDRDEEKLVDELESTWSISSPGRARAGPAVHHQTDSVPSRVRTRETTGSILGRRQGGTEGSSFHIRTDTPASRSRQETRGRELPHAEMQGGTALRSIPVGWQVGAGGKEKNWFRPPKAKRTRHEVGFEQAEWQGLSVGYGVSEAEKGGRHQSTEEVLLHEEDKENWEDCGTAYHQEALMSMDIEERSLGHMDHRLGDLDLYHERQVTEVHGTTVDRYEAEDDRDEHDELRGQDRWYSHPHQVEPWDHLMEIDMDGMDAGDHARMNEDVAQGEEEEPAIDVFGTRVSELERQIFAGGPGRW